MEYFNGKTEDDKKIIHLYILNKCTHKCKLCCNKLYSVDEIPVVTVEELKNAETICLTGGEPFLLNCIDDFAGTIKLQYPNIKNIYIYTCGDSLLNWLKTDIVTFTGIYSIDGVNISPKNKYDAECVNTLFSDYFKPYLKDLKSNRVYIFPEIEEYINTSLIDLPNTKVINRKWQENFEPDSGIFRRLPVLFR